jgi:hypothetical protein
MDVQSLLQILGNIGRAVGDDSDLLGAHIHLPLGTVLAIKTTTNPNRMKDHTLIDLNIKLGCG